MMLTRDLFRRLPAWLLFAVSLCSMAGAKTFLTKEQALQLAFDNGEKITTKTVTPTRAQQDKIRKLGRVSPAAAPFTYYVGTSKDKVRGYAVIASVKGLREPINYMMAVNPDGTVRMVEIMTYDEPRGGEVQQRSFLQQFEGKNVTDPLRVGNDIRNIAGATISCRAVSEGVRGQLAHLTVLVPLHQEKAASIDAASRLRLADAREPGTGALQPYLRAQYLMGTLMELLVYAPERGHADRAMTLAFAEVARVEAWCSVYQPDSDIARLNAAAANQPVAVAPEVLDLLARCDMFSRRTGGAFDITAGPLVQLWRDAEAAQRLPATEALAAGRDRIGMAQVTLSPTAGTATCTRPGMQVNLGGIAKGYALDRAAAVLRAQGVQAALLNFGGQVLALGLPPQQAYWTVEVRNPHDPWNAEQRLTTLRLTQGSISTSADYARGLTIQGQPYSHIVDPRTGLPVAGMRSATVIAPTATEADALSTALYVLGMHDGQRLLTEQGLAALLVPAQGDPVRSTAFAAQEAEMLARR